MTSSALPRLDPAEHRAIGRAITRALNAANAPPEAEGGRAHRIGITGPPGVGKSTLIAALARHIVRERGERVGIVASDPCSPRSGGAFLGDRVRLAGFRLADEARIFFRSIAATPEPGSTERRARRAADVLDAAGYPWILVETVGAGQMDLAIREFVQTTVVVVSPDLGDEMQLLKAGLLEIGDVFAVTRRDRPGAERFRELLEERLGFGAEHGDDAAARIVMIDSIRGEGVDALAEILASARR